MIDDVIGVLDGLSLASESSSEVIEQNMICSGYHSDTIVNNIFACSPGSKVFFCTINFLGSWHDGSLMTNVFLKKTHLIILSACHASIFTH
jgi:hypothetical protein